MIPNITIGDISIDCANPQRMRDFYAAVMGHFKNGPYIIEDIVLDIPKNEVEQRNDEIIEAVYRINNCEYSPIKRFMGKEI